MTFGKHLILDCTGFNDNMRSKKVIQDFINDLVIYVLKMKKKGETIFEYFPDNDYNRIRDIVGFSVVQVISLSSITLHLNDISRIFTDKCPRLSQISQMTGRVKNIFK